MVANTGQTAPNNYRSKAGAQSNPVGAAARTSKSTRSTGSDSPYAAPAISLGNFGNQTPAHAYDQLRQSGIPLQYRAPGSSTPAQTPNVGRIGTGLAGRGAQGSGRTLPVGVIGTQRGGGGLTGLLGRGGGGTGGYLQPFGATSTNAGGGAAPSQYGFDQSAAASGRLQGDIQALVGGGSDLIRNRIQGSPVGQRLAEILANRQGYSPEELAASRRAIDSGAAQEAVARTTRLKSALGARGFAGSPVAAFMEGQIGADVGRTQKARRDELTVADREMARTLEQSAIDDMLAMLGLEQGAIDSAANALGQFQFPFLTDEAGGAAAGGGGAGGPAGAPGPSGYGGSILPGNQLATQGNGLLAGSMVTPGAAPSQSQFNTLVGNHQYRARTGQDIPRLADGRVFYGFTGR